MIINGKEYKFIIRETGTQFYVQWATLFAGLPFVKMDYKDVAMRFDTVEEVKKYMRKNKLKMKFHTIEVEEINNDKNMDA